MSTPPTQPTRADAEDKPAIAVFERIEEYAAVLENYEQAILRRQNAMTAYITLNVLFLLDEATT